MVPIGHHLSAGMIGIAAPGVGSFPPVSDAKAVPVCMSVMTLEWGAARVVNADTLKRSTGRLIARPAARFITVQHVCDNIPNDSDGFPPPQLLQTSLRV